MHVRSVTPRRAGTAPTSSIGPARPIAGSRPLASRKAAPMLRLSTLFVRTLREDPSDAEVASHRLLVRAGYIRAPPPGCTRGCRWA